MEANRRQFILGILGLAAAAKLEGKTCAIHRAVHAPHPDASYGSGHFGRWTDDEFGLPAFEYTCNQTTDPKAATDIKPGILRPTEHIHQVGNDRITALASNFGHGAFARTRETRRFCMISTPRPASLAAESAT
jgi:hypothetical protein